MKACLCGLLLLVAAAPLARAAILTEPSHHVEGRWLELKASMDAKILAMIERAKAKHNVEKLDQCPDMNSVGKRLIVCYQSVNPAENSLELRLISPASSFDLSFSNIDLDDTASDIQVEPYLKEYEESLEQLVLSVEERKTQIKSSIDAGLKKLEAEAESGVSGSSVNDNSLTYTYNNKQYTINYDIKGDALEFMSDFSKQTIDLNIPFKKIMAFEVAKMTREVVDSNNLMNRFALSDTSADTQGGSQKNIDCAILMGDENLKKRLSVRLADNQLTLEGSNPLTIAANSQTISIKCEDRPQGEFKLSVITADFKGVSGNIPDVVQPFLGKSLYDLRPVAESFFNEMATFAIRLLSSKINEEIIDDPDA